MKTRLFTVAAIAAIIAAGVAAVSVQAAKAEKQVAEKGFTSIFDGTNLKDWKQCGPGNFQLEADGSIQGIGGMGMLWYPKKSYKDFVLRVDWKVARKEDNSGIFVRFPDPGDDPWVAVNKGYEIQICDPADPTHRTGSVYSFARAIEPPTKPVGEWNTMEIRVIGQKYTVKVNGTITSVYTGSRGAEGYIGLQNHGGADKIWFRNIRVMEIK